MLFPKKWTNEPHGIVQKGSKSLLSKVAVKFPKNAKLNLQSQKNEDCNKK